MFDFIFKIYKDLTDSGKTLFQKLTIYIIIVLALIMVDNIFGFSYYHNISNKIEKINSLNAIIKDSTILTKSELKKVKSIRKDIVNHTNIKEDVYNFISNSSFTKTKTNNSDLKTMPINSDRNQTLHYITSSFSLIIMMIAFIIVAIDDKKNIFIAKVITLLLIGFALYLISILFSKLLNLIPIIYGNEILNYILNVIISCLTIFLLIYFDIKIKKNKKMI